MAVLSKIAVQTFYRELSTSKYKSDYDREFLANNSLETLYAYDIESWIQVFSIRLKALQKTDFDWTKIGLGSNTCNWAKSKQHSNYHWFQLANKIAEIGDKHITEVIFAGVAISKKDRVHLHKAKQFASLIYSHKFERLILINRILKVAEYNPINFASHDGNDDEYPISPFELLQIRNRLTKRSDKGLPIVIVNWKAYREQYIGVWGTQSVSENFENLIHPLYEIVSKYFVNLANSGSTDAIHDLVNQFYDDELKDLHKSEATYFYGQCIEQGDTVEKSIYLHDILLDLMEVNDLNLILPTMVKLAVWITMINPAMLSSHPEVHEMYRSLKLGPYLTQQKLSKELIKLVRYRAELQSDDLELVTTICEHLAGSEIVTGETNNQLLQDRFDDEELFKNIKELFRLREEYNQSESFTYIGKTGIVAGSYQYVYNRTGVNAQYIRIAQLLQSSGFLNHFGIEDYFQLLMPDLVSPYDSVTGELLSHYRWADYIRPEHDKTYLIYLGNSAANYVANDRCFYNVNTDKSGPFSPKEFECISLYASMKFRKYSRIPKFTQYSLRASILQALVDLVNNSSNYSATLDGEGYRLQEGFSESWSQVSEKTVEYEIETSGISYQIRDAWKRERIHTDTIVFKNLAEKKAFNNSNLAQRLMFILHVAINRGHARSNVSIEKYYQAYMAYTKFRPIYLALPPEERERLNKVSMRYAGKVRTFGEVYCYGFPDCMAAASKWFSTLVLDYLPDVQFCPEVEDNTKHNEYLFYARRDSQNLYYYIVNDLTNSIGELVQKLTTVNPIISFLSLKEQGLKFLGVNAEPELNPNIAKLLCISDSSQGLLSRVSMFSGGKEKPLKIAQYLMDSGASSESTSIDLTTEDSSYDSPIEGSQVSSDCVSLGSDLSMFSSTKTSRCHTPRTLSLTSSEGDDEEKVFVQLDHAMGITLKVTA